jgi:chromate transporter
MSTENPAHPSLGALTAVSLKIGALGFGGPAGQIALMHREFVERRGWIDEKSYLSALGFCTLLPGPEAQQLATWAGWKLHGVKGGVIAGGLFVLPGALILFALAWAYAVFGQTPLMAAAFLGVKAAVLALVVEALLRVGKRALKTRAHLVIAALGFAALYLAGAPYPLVILAAAVFGWITAAAPTQPPVAMEPPRGAFRAALVWGGVWLTPLVAAIALLGPGHVLSKVGILFAQLSVVTFGGAYAMLAYLQQQAVDVQGWLTAGQMIDGFGLAETTPGPLVLVNQFVGFLAGWQAPGGGLALAAACALMASWQTFAPSFVWIFAGAPHAERLRASPKAQGVLGAITAVVLGVIASLALWFGQHVLFAREITFARPWGGALVLPDLTSLQLVPAVIATAAGVALLRFHLNVLLLIGLCLLAGIAAYLLG